MANLNTENLGILAQNDLIVLFDLKILPHLENYDIDSISSNILGACELRYNNTFKSMEIESIFARSGRGVLMYLCAMEYSKPKYLIPTRQDKITPKAKNVWKEFIYGKGSHLIKSKPLEANHHKEDFLNMAVTTVNFEKQFTSMVMSGQDILRDDPHGEWETMIIEEGDSLLANSMREIYW